MATAKEILIETQTLLQDERNWSKGAWAHTEDGEKVMYDDTRAVCWCIGGAIELASIKIASYDERRRAWDLAASCTPEEFTGDLVAFNDASSTTHEEIMSTLACAIEKAS